MDKEIEPFAFVLLHCRTRVIQSGEIEQSIVAMNQAN
jgi:hypothetical protein